MRKDHVMARIRLTLMAVPSGVPGTRVGRRCVSVKIALGVSGGIAAYKAAEIVRLLQDQGIRVQVIMTQAAQEFIRPLTFAALSGEKVITGMFAAGEQTPNIDSAVEHVALAQSIDSLAGRSRHRRCSRQIRARHRQRFSDHALSSHHRAGGRRSRHERQHVEPPRDPSQHRDSQEARRESG